MGSVPEAPSPAVGMAIFPTPDQGPKPAWPISGCKMRGLRISPPPALQITSRHNRGDAGVVRSRPATPPSTLPAHPDLAEKMFRA